MPGCLIFFDNDHLSRSGDVSPNRLLFQTSIAFEVISKYVTINARHVISLGKIQGGQYTLAAPFSSSKDDLLRALGEIPFEPPSLTPNDFFREEYQGLSVPEVIKAHSSMRSGSLVSCFQLSSLVCTESITGSDENYLILFCTRQFVHGDPNENSSGLEKIQREVLKGLEGDYKVLFVNLGHKDYIKDNEKELEKLCGGKGKVENPTVKTYFMSGCPEEEKASSDKILEEVMGFLELSTPRPGSTDDGFGQFFSGNYGDEMDPELQKALEISLWDK